MNRTAVFVLVSAFVLSACIPLPFPGQPTAAPAVDTQATEAALAAETLNALPTPTVITATDTLAPIATDTKSPTATKTVTETLTPAPNLTATQTTTATTTATATTISQINATATVTLYPRFFGTLPPAIPFGKVALINKAKADVYVSLQCTTIDGYKTILEYPVFGRLRVSAPAGRYTYVAWVGGRQFQGSFHLSQGEDISITFNKDKVTLK
jgi:hypothetical protein